MKGNLLLVITVIAILMIVTMTSAGAQEEPDNPTDFPETCVRNGGHILWTWAGLLNRGEVTWGWDFWGPHFDIRYYNYATNTYFDECRTDIWNPCNETTILPYAEYRDNNTDFLGVCFMSSDFDKQLVAIQASLPIVFRR